jgi:iron complex outermembrane recepter protein
METNKFSRRKTRLKPGLNIVIGICLPIMVIAQPVPLDLTGASLEDLMNIQVTSVSRKEQPLSRAGSAIYVITQDDIRHSGATIVPDLLRMVPGVDVARISANAWAISIRGFNYRYSGKVLVLVDGRTVYSPGFSGVYWDQQSMPLENIDRIEVIRGPGGTVWGANAMNGVINIMTKSAAETRGGLIGASAGSQASAQSLVQYGGPAGAKGSWRAFGRYARTEDSPAAAVTPATDSGHSSQMGFRSDWNLSHQDTATVQGDMLGASESQTITTMFSNRLPDMHTFDDKVRVATGNILGRWHHVFSDGSETTVQTYYDRFRRLDQALNVLNTGDIDFQYHFNAGARNDIVTGMGYRLTDQTYAGGYEVTFANGQRRDNLFSSFIQDEISLGSSVSLTLGVKFEHNAYTGYEYEPGVQLVWSPSKRQTVWASAAKAIQQPSWLYADSQLDIATVPVPGVGFGVVHISGNPASTAPRVFDYELGYRTELSKRFSMDTTIFLGDYRRLLTLEPQAPYFTPVPTPAHLVIPNVYANLGNAKNYGVELSGHWDVAGWWRISPGFSFLRMNVSQDPRSQDASFAATPGDSPAHLAQLRSTMKLRRHLEWDNSAYFNGSLTGGSTASGPVAAYTRLDTRMGWRVGESVEISVAGQNLLTPGHVEFRDGLQVNPTPAARGVIGKIVWSF